ncbi:MAG: helix-turn-helix transcriptional regulator [Deltaproteobacteria bacterium]|nr:helix-turn-helix transcriptional regulator [Deltaproteobacteria bacterium]
MANVDLKVLGRRIRAAREGRGLAQAQLAERAGTSVESVSRSERGARSPSFIVSRASPAYSTCHSTSSLTRDMSGHPLHRVVHSRVSSFCSPRSTTQR